MKLQDILHYDPLTGEWTWIVGRQGVKVPQAGIKNEYGYMQIQVDGRIYRSHRLAWFYMTGLWPNGDIDHINGNRLDNRWANLREASRSQNNANSKKRKDNRSGLKGVHWRAERKKWQAKIGFGRKGIHLGYFPTKEEAHAAYLAAANRYYGAFANAGDY